MIPKAKLGFRMTDQIDDVFRFDTILNFIFANNSRLAEKFFNDIFLWFCGFQIAIQTFL